MNKGHSYTTERLVLRPLEKEDALLLLDYYRRNKEFLTPWEPSWEKNFFSRERMEGIIACEEDARKARSGLALYAFKKDNPHRLIGKAALSNIVYGAFLSCFLGYKLDAGEIRQGYAVEMIREISRIAFEDYGLHRIEANIIPENAASRASAVRAGYTEEGRSTSYLKINGRWRDHIHYVLLNVNFG